MILARRFNAGFTGALFRSSRATIENQEEQSSLNATMMVVTLGAGVETPG
jgi:hypothetical protein